MSDEQEFIPIEQHTLTFYGKPIIVVRLPDGRVIRAKSTKSLRYHIRSGRIPVHARVRRSPAEEWTALEWVAEFVDILSKGTAATPIRPVPASPGEIAGRKPRLDEARVPGLRGVVVGLVNALESTLHAIKLAPAAGLGLLLGVGADGRLS